MQVFLAGSPVTIPTVFTDDSGNPLEVVSARYRVLGHSGEELLPNTYIFGAPKPTEPEVPTEPDAPAGDGTDAPAEPTEPPTELLTEQETGGEQQPEPPATMPLQVVIPSNLNLIPLLFPEEVESEDIDGVSVRQLRTVEFRLRLAPGGTVLRRVIYALEPSEVLIAGLNSFQSYSEAALTALSIPGLAGWDGASEQQRIAALLEARQRICRLHFRDASRGQNYLNHSGDIGDLSRIAPREFQNLSVRLRAALRKAQVAEADALLGGDPETERRKTGLVHETVGESSQTWRQTKPLELPVGRKALGYLAGFISLTKQIGRAN